MRQEDFVIGGTFWCSGFPWRCTDIGRRVITAIKLDRDDDPSWYNGPPYGVAEIVFDEYDIEGCTLEPDPADGEPSSTVPAADPMQTAEDDWDSPERNAGRMAQASDLRETARAGGMRFEAYLPPGLADWLLAHIEKGTFRDPSEAVFVMLGEQQELEPHADLRKEFLQRRIQAGINSGPGIPAEEVFRELKERANTPRREPAIWRKQP